MKNDYQIPAHFADQLLIWFDQNGRKNLPWQRPGDAYKIWISEIMLQQTQVKTVIPYFNRFMARFPTIDALVTAAEDEILSYWSGLGYYSRARNIIRCAHRIYDKHQGIFPQNKAELEQLPGIGPSTAAAILSQAFNLPHAILDSNVKRVLSRLFEIKGDIQSAANSKKLWQLAQSLMKTSRCAHYTQAIMDLGALCCTAKRPNCAECPVQSHCQAFNNNTQACYPEKKSKKIIPIQYLQFLVLYRKDFGIYLEKKPPAGIWGGLWCFPHIDVTQCPLIFIKEQYGLIADEAKPLTTMKHRFSHLHMEIEVLGIKVTQQAHSIYEQRGKWFNDNKINTVGLAKPTSRILTLIEKGNYFID